MADKKTVDDEIGFTSKRNFDGHNAVEEKIEVAEYDSTKKQKLEIPSEKNDINGKSPHFPDEKIAIELEDEEDDEEDYQADEDDSDDEGRSDEEPKTVDRKGKGIAVNDKGKGKLLVDSEDDDSSGDSDNNLSDGLDSDVEDDLLAEVDLNNILPSRTRNRGAQAGLRISSNSDDKEHLIPGEDILFPKMRKGAVDR